MSTIGAAPGAVHFFDDAPANVRAAREAGLHAHHTPGFERLKGKLAELGMIV